MFLHYLQNDMLQQILGIEDFCNLSEKVRARKMEVGSSHTQDSWLVIVEEILMEKRVDVVMNPPNVNAFPI